MNTGKIPFLWKNFGFKLRMTYVVKIQVHSLWGEFLQCIVDWSLLIVEHMIKANLFQPITFIVASSWANHFAALKNTNQALQFSCTSEYKRSHLEKNCNKIFWGQMHTDWLDG